MSSAELLEEYRKYEPIEVQTMNLRFSPWNVNIMRSNLKKILVDPVNRIFIVVVFVEMIVDFINEKLTCGEKDAFLCSGYSLFTFYTARSIFYGAVIILFIINNSSVNHVRKLNVWERLICFVLTLGSISMGCAFSIFDLDANIVVQLLMCAFIILMVIIHYCYFCSVVRFFMTMRSVFRCTISDKPYYCDTDIYILNGYRSASSDDEKKQYVNSKRGNLKECAEFNDTRVILVGISLGANLLFLLPSVFHDRERPPGLAFFAWTALLVLAEVINITVVIDSISKIEKAGVSLNIDSYGQYVYLLLGGGFFLNTLVSILKYYHDGPS